MTNLHGPALPVACLFLHLRLHGLCDNTYKISKATRFPLCGGRVFSLLLRVAYFTRTVVTMQRTVLLCGRQQNDVCILDCRYMICDVSLW
jgi:lysylphosphatidylglycerol synthetase-like protein (DUF2156 family)